MCLGHEGFGPNIKALKLYGAFSNISVTRFFLLSYGNISANRSSYPGESMLLSVTKDHAVAAALHPLEAWKYSAPPGASTALMRWTSALWPHTSCFANPWFTESLQPFLTRMPRLSCEGGATVFNGLDMINVKPTDRAGIFGVG